MKETNENLIEYDLKGEFKIDKKCCFCCNKIVNIYFFSTKDKLLFYIDKAKKKLYKEILIKLVLAINRRFRTQEDRNKLSIYYLEKENSAMIKELKLKANNKMEMEKWIYILNKKIKPKRVQFPTLSNNYVKSNDVFHFKNETNFYVALCNLEYILLRNKFKYIFDIYKSLPKNIDTTKTFYEDELSIGSFKKM